MPASPPTLCPVCSLPVTQRAAQVRQWGQRWHSACWPGPKVGGARPGAGRPALPPGEALTLRLVARVTLAEWRRVDAHCRAQDITPADLIRARLADILYRH